MGSTYPVGWCLLGIVRVFASVPLDESGRRNADISRRYSFSPYLLAIFGLKVGYIFVMCGL